MILDELTYEQCVAQGVGPLVFPSRLERGIDPANSIRMKAVCLQTIQEQVKLSHTLSEAWKGLEDAGIQPILMKGAGLAALYPEPSMRHWSDIDLFVGKDQYHPACAAMRNAFPEALKFDEEKDYYKHYNLIADGVAIEVHRVTMAMQHPIDARRYAKMEMYGMVNGEWLMVNGLKVKIFEPTFNTLFVFLHSWEHMLSSGAHIRQLYDLCLLLQHYADRIDHERLGRWLRVLHLMDVWQLYMSLCVKHLDLPANGAPFLNNNKGLIDRSERLWEALIAGRMMAPENEATDCPKNRFLRKWCTMKIRMRNADRIGQFSPAYARHMRMGILLNGISRLFAKDRKWE